MLKNIHCPCRGIHVQGLPKTLPLYRDCCSRFMESGEAVPDALHLMRSRYSAFVLKNAPYLLSSWHISTRPDSVNFDKCQWQGLEIHAFISPSLLDQTPLKAEVHFTARMRQGLKITKLFERSVFVQEDGLWQYLCDI